MAEEMIVGEDPCLDSVTQCSSDADCTDPDLPVCGPYQACPSLGSACSVPCGPAAEGGAACSVPFECNTESAVCEMPACRDDTHCGFGYTCDPSEDAQDLAFSYENSKPLGCKPATCGTPNASACTRYQACEPEHPDANEIGCRRAFCDEDPVDCGHLSVCDPGAATANDSGCRRTRCDEDPNVNCGLGSCAPDDPNAMSNGCVRPADGGGAAGGGGTATGALGAACGSDADCASSPCVLGACAADLGTCR